MIIRQIASATPIFLAIFIFQESVISQFRLPGGGFSLLMIFTLIWSVLSQREVAAVIGFSAGLLMDLSQSSIGPFGQWSLIMLMAGYAISYVGYGDDNIHGNAIGIVFFVTIANLLAELVFLLSGALLGVENPTFAQIVFTLFGMSVWVLLIAPIMLPISTKLHSLVFKSSAII